MSLPSLPVPNVECISGIREPFVFYDADHMREYGQQCRAAALEEAALFIENGSFMHDQSPAKLFADQIAPKIRGMK